jgi:hypothetical protein
VLPGSGNEMMRTKTVTPFAPASPAAEQTGRSASALALSERKSKLARLLTRAPAGIVYNEHTDEDGATVFRLACKTASRASCRSA